MTDSVPSRNSNTKPVHHDRPQLSVFMSSYNAGEYLAESVDSVLNQTFTDFEFVIVNDGSTDDSAAYLKSLKDPRVRIIHRDNMGIGKPLNTPMRSCRGEFIVRVDADDICEPERFEKQVRYLTERPACILAGCHYRCFTDSGRVRKSTYLPTDHAQILSGMMKGWHTLAHATIIFRRSLLEQTPGYLITGVGEDWSFLLDAARHGKLGMVDEPLYRVRVHPNSNAWRGAEKVILGFRFARQRHQRFLDGNKNDLGSEEFFRRWEKAGLFSRLSVRMATQSAVMHRKSISSDLNGQPISAALRLFIASILDPHKTLGAIWKIGRSKKTQKAEPNYLSAPDLKPPCIR